MNDDNGRHPIILFDGVCNLCNKVVRFTIKNDPEGIFRFASLQSKPGKELLKKFNLPLTDHRTFILIEGPNAYFKSDAALMVIRNLSGSWKWLYFLKIIPRTIRDFFYDMISANRYKWFGKKDSCMVPSPEIKRRFLD